MSDTTGHEAAARALAAALTERDGRLWLLVPQRERDAEPEPSSTQDAEHPSEDNR